MIRLKNIRPGIVLIPGHRLRLSPGSVASIETVSPEIERALTAGLLVRVEDAGRAPDPSPILDNDADPSGDEPTSTPPPEKIHHEPLPSAPDVTAEEIAKLPQTEATHRVAQEKDAKKLRALLSLDKRPRVQDSIRRRLSEIESGGSR